MTVIHSPKDIQKLIALDPKVEAQLPEMVRMVRSFYRSLSPEDRAKLDAKVENKIGESPQQKTKANVSKFCFECGGTINRIAKFCEYCGTKQPDLTD